MDATQFAYWLQGYSEITNGQLPNATQWQVVTDHLKMTLKEPPYDGLSGVSLPSLFASTSPTGFLCITGTVWNGPSLGSLNSITIC